MPRIFISYRQTETQGVAHRLFERLRLHYGAQVFMNISQVPLGSDFRQFIAREVERSDVVLVLIGERWLEMVQARANQAQDFVRTEIEIALARNLLTVPVLIGAPVVMPREDELPARIGQLAYLQGFRLLPEGDFEEQVQALMAGLEHALLLRAAPTASRPRPEEAERPFEAPESRQARKRRVVCAELDLLWVEPGSFWMGSPPDEPGRWPDEGPQHLVSMVHGYWLGVAPVTQGQFSRIMESNPSFFREAGEDAPVEMVSWLDAREFCLAIQRREPAPAGFEFRFPYEAEWEYACRAGSQSALYSGSMDLEGAYRSARLDPIGWYGGNSGVDYAGGVDSSSWFEKQYDHQTAGTHPVARKLPNSWGFYDMLGNVWEWCWDGKRAYQTTAAASPMGPVDGGPRVIRGGSWEDGPGDCRCATRFAAGPKHRFAYLGFRLALGPAVGH